MLKFKTNKLKPFSKTFKKHHVGKLSDYTCFGCGCKYHCEFVWDWYNTHGDCLMEK